MAEYIERKELIRQIKLHAKRTMLGETTEPYMTWQDIMRLLLDAPIADVVEVVHERCRYCSPEDCGGLKWDFEDIEVSVTLQRGVLTICNEYGEEAEMPIRYCPNCGARMDGDV